MVLGRALTFFDPGTARTQREYARRMSCRSERERHHHDLRPINYADDLVPIPVRANAVRAPLSNADRWNLIVDVNGLRVANLFSGHVHRAHMRALVERE